MAWSQLGNKPSWLNEHNDSQSHHWFLDFFIMTYFYSHVSFIYDVWSFLIYQRPTHLLVLPPLVSIRRPTHLLWSVFVTAQDVWSTLISSLVNTQNQHIPYAHPWHPRDSTFWHGFLWSALGNITCVIFLFFFTRDILIPIAAANHRVIWSSHGHQQNEPKTSPVFPKSTQITGKLNIKVNLLFGNNSLFRSCQLVTQLVAINKGNIPI